MINLDSETLNIEKSPVQKKNYMGFLLTIAVFLALLLMVEAYQVITTYQQNKLAEERASAYKARVEEAQQLITEQQAVILGLIPDYEKNAYGSNVDRIAEQQLLASEYSLTALQIIALQNSQIIELLANAP